MKCAKAKIRTRNIFANQLVLVTSFARAPLPPLPARISGIGISVPRELEKPETKGWEALI